LVSEKQILLNSTSQFSNIINDWSSNKVEVDSFLRLVDSTTSTLRNDGKIIFFGNGGSAAEASHLAGEFVGKCETDVGAQPAISLTDSGPILTAIANDWDFDEVFARQIKAVGKPGDLIIGLSTSGSSTNVLRGLLEGKQNGLKTSLWTSTRFNGETHFIDHLLIAPTERTPRAQELHLMLGHVLCEYVEIMFKSK
jgi:D-sedoheptulose 7-phosphate isomerase